MACLSRNPLLSTSPTSGYFRSSGLIVCGRRMDNCCACRKKIAAKRYPSCPAANTNLMAAQAFRRSLTNLMEAIHRRQIRERSSKRRSSSGCSARPTGIPRISACALISSEISDDAALRHHLDAAQLGCRSDRPAPDEVGHGYRRQAPLRGQHCGCRHFLQTAKSCSIPDKTLKDIVTELKDTSAKCIDDTIARMPKDFPEPVAKSISDAAKHRLSLLTVPDEA